MNLEEIKQLSEPLVRLFGNYRLEVAGSVRRGFVEPNNLNLLTTAPYGLVKRTLMEIYGTVIIEPFCSIVILVKSFPVKITSCNPDSWGAAHLTWTGSLEFTKLLRKWAKSQGKLLNNQALWENGNRIASATETGIFEALGIPWIPPEERL